MSDNEYKTESYTSLKAKCKYSSLDIYESILILTDTK